MKQPILSATRAPARLPRSLAGDLDYPIRGSRRSASAGGRHRPAMPHAGAKLETQRQWNANPCGADVAADLERGSPAFFRSVEEHRYEVYAPWLKEAIGFQSFGGRRVLEIGPGLGTDHAQFARAGAQTYAIDLTKTHLELTRRRFALDQLKT